MGIIICILFIQKKLMARKKIKDKYLGKITETGLIPPVEKTIEYNVKKVGLTTFIFSSCHNIIQNIYKQGFL